MSILIKNILFEQEETSIRIEKNKIAKIGKSLPEDADIIIDGKDKAVVPGFVNGHTHAAMSLFRGFADDIVLEPWLQKIWDRETRLNKEIVYAGTKLACLEMIKNGVTSFTDMYWYASSAAEAVEEMGLRAKLCYVVFDQFNVQKREENIQKIQEEHQKFKVFSDRIQFFLGPHALYTVSTELLKWCVEYAQIHNLDIQIHGAETQTECRTSLDRFGLTPIRYFDATGLLNPNLSIAHSIYVDDEEIELLAKHRVKVIYNVNSNLKIGSGTDFKYQAMKDAGVTVIMGTDGCCSSNNLDILEAVKHAALVQKGIHRNPEILPAREAFQIITENGAELMNQPIGKIAEGYLADLCLIDLKQSVFTPSLNHNFISNLIYAANGSCIDTVICNGKILMQNRVVEGEQEILKQAQKAAERFF